MHYLINLSRRKKRLILLGSDVFLVPLSLYCAFALRFGTALPFDRIAESMALVLGLTLVSVPIFLLVGLNRIKLIAFELHDIRLGAIAAMMLMGAATTLSYIFGLEAPRSIALIFGPMFLISHIALRIGAVSMMMRFSRGTGAPIPIAIYGAGSAGVQLLAGLRRDPQMRPVVFVDDNKTLQSMTVSGLPVKSRPGLRKMIEAKKVRRVLLAMPSVPEHVRREKVVELSKLGCEVFALPSYAEMVNGTDLASNLRQVTPDMLLARDKVDLEVPEVARSYAGRSVMVTGAGGSIGSELCRQVLSCNPHQLILFDHSEFALYSIARELKPIAENLGVKIRARLGDVCDPNLVKRVLEENSVDILLHAAAYKHVPIVEENEIEGVRNNVVGTQVMAEAARSCGVERFILVSTDKAVRPTNVMGASKRLAEMVIQDLQTRSTGTKFAMVRFGNVLGSSGSVIPLFQKQISDGGPVTITHEDITRFFMTIPEASRLVLLAGAFATGGDVFVLDMGSPVNIRDLACKMIKLSGLRVRDAANPDGDIEIRTIGLRPGEKLYEELLIGNDVLPTPHAKILRAQEKFPSEIEIAKILREIENSIQDGDAALLRDTIRRSVDGYHVTEELWQKATG